MITLSIISALFACAFGYSFYQEPEGSKKRDGANFAFGIFFMLAWIFAIIAAITGR